MEYLNSTFTKPWRRFVFGLFVTTFFILSPLIIAYTMGYRYDWKDGLLRETGAISIDILPKKSSIYINDQKINSSIPIRLNNITPNLYSLQISAKGYYDWYKEIEVKNKQTVYIKEIELIKKNKPVLIAPLPIDLVTLSPQGNYLVYKTQTSSPKKLTIRNNRNGKEYVINYPLSSTSDELVSSWSKNDHYILLYENNIKNNDVFPTVFNTLQPEKNNGTRLKTEGMIKKTQWSGNLNDTKLYFSTSDNTIMVYDPLTDTSKILLEAHNLDWYVGEEFVTTLTLNTTTAQLTLHQYNLANGNEIKTILLHGDLFNNKNFLEKWHIKNVTPKTTILSKKDENESYVLTSEGQEFNLLNTKYFQSPYNNWQLFWNNWELWSYAEGESPTLLNRSGEELKEVFPLDQYNTLLLMWNQKTSIFYPYYRVMHDFLNESLKIVRVDTAQKIIYFTKNSQDGLWKLVY
jgi:hypothetical protein